MAKFAPVVPAVLSPQLDVGYYHLLQAHDVLRATDPTQENGYLIDWLIGRVESPHHHVIFDNGVVELGEADVDSLLLAGEVWQPDELVCPDALNDADETCRLFQEHVEEVAKICSSVMVVPQGESLLEWCDCVDRLAHYAAEQHINITFGVSKFVDKYRIPRYSTEDIPRTYAVTWLSDYMHQADMWHQVHLLGINKNLWELRKLLTHDAVRGLDSTLPYALGLNHELLGFGSPKVGIDENDWLGTQDEKALRYSEINIAWVKTACEREYRW